MGYVRTAGMSTAARRRRRRTALVLSGLLLLLAGVFIYSAAYFQGWLPAAEGGDDTDQTSATAATEAPEPKPEPSEITVNVYNASNRAGLAGRTAEALESRGYQVGEVANDPEQAEVEVAEVRYGAEGRSSTSQLRDLLPDATTAPDEGREGATIDLVLGEGFEELEPVEDGASSGAG